MIQPLYIPLDDITYRTNTKNLKTLLPVISATINEKNGLISFFVSVSRRNVNYYRVKISRLLELMQIRYQHTIPFIQLPPPLQSLQHIQQHCHPFWTRRNIIFQAAHFMSRQFLVVR
jgi:hypothetical protein